MFIIYRGYGFALFLCAPLILLPLLLISMSFTLPLLGLAIFWIYFGREKRDAETGEITPSPSVYFIPIWLWGALVVPLALIALGVEAVNGRIPATVLSDDRPPAINKGNVPGDTPQKTIGAAVATMESDPANPKRVTPPGEVIDNVNSLQPGERLLALYGGQWDPIDVVGVRNETQISAAYVGSHKYRSWPVALTDLRRVSPETLAKYPPKYHDGALPPPGSSLAATDTVEAGMQLLAPVNDAWLNVKVLEVQGDDKLVVEYEKFPGKPSSVVSTSQLRKPFSEVAQVANVHRSQPTPEGEQVDGGEELRPGQRVLAQWGRRWAPVDIVEINDAGVKVAYVGSKSWTSFGHRFADLLIVSPEVLKQFPNKYSDGPPEPPGKSIDDLTGMMPGDKVFARAGDVWIPAVVNDVTDGHALVHFETFDARWDQELTSEQLRQP